MLIGIVLSSFLDGESIVKEQKDIPFYGLTMVASAVCLVLGVTRFFPGSPGGAASAAIPASPVIPAATFSVAGASLVALGVVLAFVGPKVLGAAPADTLAARIAGGPTAEQEKSHEQMILGAASLAGALGLVLVARDLVLKPEFADQPGVIRFLHLFTYNYRRPWPDALDFTAIMIGFSAVASLGFALLAWRRWRKHVVMGLLAFGVVWAVWGLDVYLVKTSPHWGQHELIEAYYRARANDRETLVCYQMNWKGENFYTGNQAPVFVSTGAPFTAWLKKKREEGENVFFFVTEHNRIGGLKSEVGAKSYKEITDKVLNNKFGLVRAEF
jgi:hypothetical protein